MTDSSQRCAICGKSVFRSLQRMNENQKFGWKVFCSLKCLSLSRRNQKKLICAREGCGNYFTRTPYDLSKSKAFYCSRRCAVIVSNKAHPRNPGVIKICGFCCKNFKSREKYCSTRCQHLGQIIPKSKLITFIKEFENKNGRIPYKQEIGHYSAYRGRFGTWNDAIKAAGFKPNPVMFAKKYIAKDGDKCDSLAEKIIDDWLFRYHIRHVRSFPYPGGKGYTVDFKVGEKWIEFFGLSGQLKRYDLLKKRKLRLAGNYKLNIIKIYPKDLFPINRLSDKLLTLIN